MRKLHVTISLLIVLLAPVWAGAHSIIPAPTTVREATGTFLLSRGATFSISGAEASELNAYIATQPWGLVVGKRAQVRVTLGNGSGVSSEEGYRLSVTPRGIAIYAKTEAGAFYALQTLDQLVKAEGDAAWRVPCVEIDDAPRFGYRGVMLDVSRNFRSKEFVLKQIDAMSRFKLNRLHLHLTDGAGWRIEIPAYPRLTEFAAWRPHATWFEWWSNGRRYCEANDPRASGGFYTRDELREIVAYAQQRHITIIPEVEMPGHSEEVVAAYPELSCTGEVYGGSDLCAGNEATFKFLEDVLLDVIEIFPSQYIHIGGDEAGKGAWRKCPKCQARLKAEGLTDVQELQSYFIRRIERFINSHGRRIIGWDEILEGGLAPDATVMSWRGVEGGLKAIREGHEAILAPGEFCYIDYSQDAPFTQPLSIGGYTPLRKVYSFDPTYDLTPEQQPRLLGVQANLWTEYIPTAEHVEQMLYPRTLAIAEVGWSQPAQRNYDAFRERALVAVDRLKAEGYNPFDLRSEYGERRESLEAVDHLARGKQVTYNTPWHKSYPAAVEKTLVDGVIGGWTYGDRRWQGFLDADFDVTIDLEQVMPVHYIGATFMQSAGPYVWVPRQVEIYCSEDGAEYRLLTTVHNDISPKCPDLLFKTFAFSGNEQARYVRYVARSGGISGGWLFVDEIIVR